MNCDAKHRFTKPARRNVTEERHGSASPGLAGQCEALRARIRAQADTVRELLKVDEEIKKGRGA